MAENEEGFISVFGAALIQPMFDLVETPESRPPSPPNEVKTGRSENGYSLPIIVLSVILFESALNRTAYIREKKGRIWPADYFIEISPDEKTAAEVEEIFAVRNVIAHNHLWEAKISWDEETDLKLTEPPVLQKGYGNDRHQKVTNPSTRKSQILGINMFPADLAARRLHCPPDDIKSAIGVRVDGPKLFCLSPNHFGFQKKTVTFAKLTSELVIPKDA